MSARALALGGFVAGKKTKEAKGKKKRSRAASPSTEYNLLLTATLCLLALGAVMVFSASSTTQILSNGSLSEQRLLPEAHADLRRRRPRGHAPQSPATD